MYPQYVAVKPLADMTTNLARGKPTLQSSTFKKGKSSKAVDGNRITDPTLREKRCSFTLPARKGSWWMVDLEYIYEIIRVVISSGGQLNNMNTGILLSHIHERLFICVKLFILTPITPDTPRVLSSL